MTEYLCVVCPMVCRLEINLDESGEPCVEGAACKRGRAYVLKEATAPERVLTTTLATSWGRPLPVRSAAPIAKDKVRAILPRLAAVMIDNAVSVGQVVIDDVDDQGTPLVATAAGGAPLH